MRTTPSAVAVVEDEIDELRQGVAGAEVGSGCDSLERQRGVCDRSQHHELLGFPLKLDQEQDSSSTHCLGGPDHVWMTGLQRLPGDEFGGFLAQGREVDLVGPFGHVIADQDFDDAPVGKERLEKGICTASLEGGDAKFAVVSGRIDGWIGELTDDGRVSASNGRRPLSIDRLGAAVDLAIADLDEDGLAGRMKVSET